MIIHFFGVLWQIYRSIIDHYHVEGSISGVLTFSSSTLWYDTEFIANLMVQVVQTLNLLSNANHNISTTVGINFFFVPKMLSLVFPKHICCSHGQTSLCLIESVHSTFSRRSDLFTSSLANYGLDPAVTFWGSP